MSDIDFSEATVTNTAGQTTQPDQPDAQVQPEAPEQFSAEQEAANAQYAMNYQVYLNSRTKFAVKRSCLLAVLYGVGSTILMGVLYGFISILSGILFLASQAGEPEFNQSAYDALASDSLQMLYILQLVTFAIAALIMCVAMRKDINVLSLIKPDKPMTTSKIILITLLTIGISSMGGWLSTFVSWGVESATGTPSSYDTMMENLDITSIFMFAYIIIVGPICEELVFRGLICRNIARFNRPVAVFVSAMLFALMHGTLAQIIATFPIGILLGCLSLKYGLAATIFLHIINNLLGCLPLMSDSAIMTYTLWGIEYGTMAVVLIYFIYLCVKHRHSFKTLVKSIWRLVTTTLKNSFGYCARAPFFWVMIVYAFISVLFGDIIDLNAVLMQILPEDAKPQTPDIVDPPGLFDNPYVQDYYGITQSA